jgi:hypothetical protein
MAMLYINSLKSLTPKAADIASVDIIREIKRTTPYPLAEDRLRSRFLGYFITEEDIDTMSAGLDQIGPSIASIDDLSRSKDPAFEPINLKRAQSMLSELPDPLRDNIAFLRDIMVSQEGLVKEMMILNTIPRLRTADEKKACNDSLNRIFGAILRGGDMEFRYLGIVHEGQVERISALTDSTANGFLFHYTTEEVLTRAGYDDIRGRLLKKDIESTESMLSRYHIIQSGIRRAYACNMRLIGWAVVLYSYIKWLSSGN